MGTRQLKKLLLAASTIMICLPVPSHAGFLNNLLNNININQEDQTAESSDPAQQEGSPAANTSPPEEGNLSIGDDHAGGIIFYLDNSGTHGFVASNSDINGTRTWNEAVTACKKYKKNGYSNWFLPNRGQLAELYLRRSVVGGWTPNSGYGFWSSTESDIKGAAWMQYFTTGSQYRNFQKNYLFYGRCIRAF